MEEVLKGLVGSRIDVSCGTAAVFRGKIEGVSDGVLRLLDEDDRSVYLSVDKITSVCECGDSTGRPGFIG